MLSNDVYSLLVLFMNSLPYKQAGSLDDIEEMDFF
jgi:hypothetical protein